MTSATPLGGLSTERSPIRRTPVADLLMSSSAVEISNYSAVDLPLLAEVHMEAYRGYKNAGIGRRYVREFLRYFLTSDGAIALKAEYAGQPCGYAVGLPVGRHTQLNKDLLSAYAIGADASLGFASIRISDFGQGQAQANLSQQARCFARAGRGRAKKHPEGDGADKHRGFAAVCRQRRGLGFDAGLRGSRSANEL